MKEKPPTPGVARESRATREARVAGLRNFTTPSLEDVERRRWHLWGVTFVVMAGFAGALVLLSLYPGDLPQQVAPYINLRFIRWAMLGLVLCFTGYAVEKEFHLRRLSHILIDERVLTAAFSNRLKELSRLAEVGKAVNSVLDLDDVLAMILDSCLELLEVDDGSVMLLSPDGLRLIAVAARGTGRVVGASQPIEVGVAGWVARNREAVLITGKADPRFFPGAIQRSESPAGAICVPFLSRDRLFGVLNVNDREGSREFTEYELRAISLFAEHAAIAISNARLYREEQDRVAHLMEVDELKREFLTLVSHELRTPLTSLLGSASTLETSEDRLAPDDRKELYGVIRRQGDHLLRLVEDLLLASRIESGMQLVSPQVCDLVASARDAVARFRSRPGGERVTLRIESAELAVIGDPGALQRIFGNLLENAWRYAPNAAIEVSVAAEENEAFVTVDDEGPGVVPADVPRLFGRFQQRDEAARAAGVGLGLYIVRHLVEAQGGRAWYDGESGHGGRFRFTVPRATPERARSLVFQSRPVDSSS